MLSISLWISHWVVGVFVFEVGWVVWGVRKVTRTKHLSLLLIFFYFFFHLNMCTELSPIIFFFIKNKRKKTSLLSGNYRVTINSIILNKGPSVLIEKLFDRWLKSFMQVGLLRAGLESSHGQPLPHSHVHGWAQFEPKPLESLHYLGSYSTLKG